eukprot:scaffold1088_cov247-Pinguiococcus_pyrenoidosus.AAC.20
MLTSSSGTGKRAPGTRACWFRCQTRVSWLALVLQIDAVAYLRILVMADAPEVHVLVLGHVVREQHDVPLEGFKIRQNASLVLRGRASLVQGVRVWANIEWLGKGLSYRACDGQASTGVRARELAYPWSTVSVVDGIQGSRQFHEVLCVLLGAQLQIHLVAQLESREEEAATCAILHQLSRIPYVIVAAGDNPVLSPLRGQAHLPSLIILLHLSLRVASRRAGVRIRAGVDAPRRVVREVGEKIRSRPTNADVRRRLAARRQLPRQEAQLGLAKVQVEESPVVRGVNREASERRSRDGNSLLRADADGPRPR